MGDNPFEEPLESPHPTIISNALKRSMADLFGTKNMSVRVLPTNGKDSVEVNIRNNRKEVFHRYKKDNEFQDMM